MTFDLHAPGRGPQGVALAWAAWLLTAAVFLGDVFAPTGYAIPLLFTPVVLLTMWAPRRHTAFVIAGAATVLTFFDFTFSEADGPPENLFNHALAIFVLWVTAAGVTMYRESLGRERLSIKKLEDMKYALDQAAIVAITDTDGRITYANDKFCEISKYSREELLGRTHRIINSGHHPPEFFGRLWTAISAGDVWRGEIRNRARDGTLYWVDTTIVPFLDQRGAPYQYLAIRYDITERKRSEAILREQASLAQLGKMSAVVAHEVRNPLAGMRGALQIVSGRLPSGSQERAVLHDVLGRVDALSDIVQDLLLFARPRQLALAEVSLTELLRETADQLHEDPGFTGIVFDLQLPDLICLADREQLRLAFLNLLVNSAQAMQGQGRIHATASRTSRGIELRLADDGPGLTTEARDRIFEPFFTTKHQGTGLGLATARKVLEAHGGTLRLESPPEGGVTAILALPTS
jgi:two-component system CheB/CheR fusion protein